MYVVLLFIPGYVLVALINYLIPNEMDLVKLCQYRVYDGQSEGNLFWGFIPTKK